jgi:hypothetical protein
VGDQKIWAQHDRLPITQYVFQDLVDRVKAECTSKSWFPMSFEVLVFQITWFLCFQFPVVLLFFRFI